MSNIDHYEGSLLKLKLHLENLRGCETFEHFKQCQTAFVAMLVAEGEETLLHAKADRLAKDAVDVFLHDTDFVAKIQDAAGKITETTVKTQWQVVEPAPICQLMIPERGHCPMCDEIYAHRDAVASDDPRIDPVQDDRAKRRTDLTPSQEAKGQQQVSGLYGGTVGSIISGQANNCEQEEGA